MSHRFQVHIPENYPDGDVPKIVFENSVFHPSIDPATHVLNVKQVLISQLDNRDVRGSLLFRGAGRGGAGQR